MYYYSEATKTSPKDGVDAGTKIYLLFFYYCCTYRIGMSTSPNC